MLTTFTSDKKIRRWGLTPIRGLFKDWIYWTSVLTIFLNSCWFKFSPRRRSEDEALLAMMRHSKLRHCPFQRKDLFNWYFLISRDIRRWGFASHVGTLTASPMSFSKIEFNWQITNIHLSIMIMYLMTITIVKWWSSQLIITVVIIHLLLPKLREYVNGSKSGNFAHLCASNTSASKTTSDKFFLTNTSASKGLHSDIFFLMFSNKLDYIILLVCSLKTISKCNWFVKSLQPLSSQQPIPHLVCFSTWKMLISESVLNTTNKFQMALSEARWY